MKRKTESVCLVCDCCGETFENGEGYVCYTDDYPDGSLIWSDASASGWIEVGDRHYCEKCWERDDDDNILTKDGHKYNDDGEETKRRADPMNKKDYQKRKDENRWSSESNAKPRLSIAES